MKKFIVTEEEKNRIIGLHRKLIMEQTQSEVEGQVSLDFFEKNEIYKMSSETTDGGSGTSGTSGTSGGFQETTLTVEDLKSGQTVSIGKKGPIVKQIQELLIGKGYNEVSKSGEPDSMFGSMTKAQVEKFQSENTNDKGEPLQKDGIVGPETINALLKVPTPNTKGVETAVKSYLPTGVSANL
jgi:peptidoglycan hydrolase-like protein with peptidoglycan-binding domain